MRIRILFVFSLALLCALSCQRVKNTGVGNDLTDAITNLSKNMNQSSENSGTDSGVQADVLADVLHKAGIDEALCTSIIKTASDNPAFILDLLMCLNDDPDLRRLVDKQHPLPADYVPGDLIALRGAAGDSAKSYLQSRNDLQLRKMAADGLEEMAAAARSDGVTLTASSGYRSFAYQDQVYKRNVSQMGQEAADRESARPGYSQHQTGLAMDFGSIDDSFATTEAGLWLANNASRYGWSLSYPEGFEQITGYRWESWHYRYLGKDLAAFVENYFNGIQQYALRFIYEWEKASNIEHL